MLLCQELIFLKRHFKQDAVVDVAVLLVNNSRQFRGVLSPNLFPLFSRLPRDRLFTKLRVELSLS